MCWHGAVLFLLLGKQRDTSGKAHCHCRSLYFLGLVALDALKRLAFIDSFDIILFSKAGVGGSFQKTQRISIKRKKNE